MGKLPQAHTTRAPRGFILWQLHDLFVILAILLKELIVALAILGSGRLMVSAANYLFPTRDWSVTSIVVLAELFAILAFIALAVQDLWSYFKNWRN